jgi:DNA-binding transcriptional LysR family regulator
MKNLDLNLLPQLQALLEQRNVSRAAEQLQLSQPATSAALSRLRRYFDDELLVRSGRFYELTPLAQDLVPLVNEALQQVERAVTIRSQFDPAVSDREFVIAASDFVAAMIVEPLRRILRAEAPKVSVEFVPTSTVRVDQSDFNRWDLIIAPMGYSIPGDKKQIFRDSFVAVVDSGNPVLDSDPLQAQDLVKMPHAVGYFGEMIKTPADIFWDQLGLTRKVAAHVSGLLALPMLVEGTDLVALVPRMLAYKARRGANISVIEFPVEAEPVLVEAMFWHPGRAADPASVWLRGAVQRACAQLHLFVENEQPPLHRATIDAVDTA